MARAPGQPPAEAGGTPLPRVLAVVRRVLSMPPREVARRSLRVGASVAHDVRQRLGDLLRPGVSVPDAVYRDALFGPQAVLPLVWSDPAPGAVSLGPALGSARQVLEHRFDLLGSGPTRVDYTLRAEGLGGHRYPMSPGRGAAEGQRRRMEALLGEPVENYAPIDWHVDFKSGYRWDPDRWFRSVRYGTAPGVDVKVPWELSRFQHLGVLGLAHRLAPESDVGGVAGREFRLQLADWLAANPVRRGVNWAVAMDVALRAVSWLAGAEMFRDVLEADPRLRRLLVDALVLHGRHIEANLEYDPGRNGNHYVADLLGLVAIGASLPGLADADRWVVFGLQELESEIRKQVLPDGVDVEGSTAYHGFVGEMFAVAAALAARIPAERRERLREVSAGPTRHPLAPPYRGSTDQAFDVDRAPIVSGTFLQRLGAMAVFAAEVTKPDGLIPQIGDNDSGRVLRIGPPPDPRDWRVLPALVGRMLGDPDLETVGEPWAFQASLLVPDRGAFSARGAGGPSPGTRDGEREGVVLRVQPTSSDDGAPAGDPEEVPGAALARDGVVAFPAGGVIVGRAGGLYLAAHAGLLSPTSPGGHFHNDLLSFELQWSGTDVVVDPGSFVYTPLPDARDAYRATAAHSTVAVEGREQRRWPPRRTGLFAIQEDADSVTLDRLEADGFTVTCRYGAVTHQRSWRWTVRRLEVVDRVAAPARATAFLNLAPGVEVEPDPTPGDHGWRIALRTDIGPIRLSWVGVERPRPEAGLYSVGYGKEQSCTKIRAPLRDETARLTLERAS